MGKTTFSGPIRVKPLPVGGAGTQGVPNNNLATMSVAQARHFEYDLLGVVKQVFSVAPTTASSTAFIATKALAATAEDWVPGTTSGVTAYDLGAGGTSGRYPQTLVLVCSAAQSGNVVITGTDIFGTTISETVTMNGNTAVYSNKAFASVTNFNVPAKAGSETISIGTHNATGHGRFGLMGRISSLNLASETASVAAPGNGILKEIVNGAFVATGQIQAGDPAATSTTGGDPRGTYRPATDNAICAIYYMVD